MKKIIIALALVTTSLASCSEKSKTMGSEETIYSCTMHHQVREYKDGQCPICGMDLVVVPDINDW